MGHETVNELFDKRLGLLTNNKPGRPGWATACSHAGNAIKPAYRCCAQHRRYQSSNCHLMVVLAVFVCDDNKFFPLRLF